MSRMLILQLERFGRLSSEEKLALSGVSLHSRNLARGLDLVRGQDRANTLNVLLAGFACRYAVLPNGRRQILAYLLPGDFCDPFAADLLFSDHSVTTLSAVKIAGYPHEQLLCLGRQFPRIARALELIGAAERATLYQWLLCVGHRSALERTAHLLCELFTRLRFLGLAHDGVCDIPLRQTDLADALAISPVHLNRTLKEIHRLKLATFAHHQLLIEDFPALQRLGGFESQYLFTGRMVELPESRDMQRGAESQGTSASTLS